MLASCTDPASRSGDAPTAGKDGSHVQFIEKVSYQDVTLTDDFWRPKIEINRVAGIRHALQQASQSIGYFDIAAGTTEGEHKGNLASDSGQFPPCSMS